MGADIQREFFMSEDSFRQVSELAYKYTGIVLGDHKKDMVYGRLARRMRALGLNDMKDYCPLIEEHANEEVSKFINAITTNLTSFFREEHHFDFLSDTFCQELLKNNGSTKIRGWSAACSTGEEPYSIAISLLEKLGGSRWDCKILATDLDSKVLDHAQQGVYDIDRINTMTAERKKKWFLSDRNHPDIVKVKPSLQEVVRFKRLNLLERWPMKGPFDFIFCRNVFIYFDQATQQKILNGFAEKLRPGGYLFIGHSENLHESSRYFDSLGKTIYQRK